MMAQIWRSAVRFALALVLQGVVVCTTATAQDVTIAPEVIYPPQVRQKSTSWSVSCPGKPHSDSGFGTGNTCNASDKDAERQAEACVQGIGHCFGYPAFIEIGDCTENFAMSRTGCCPAVYEYRYAIFVNGECRGYLTKRTSGGEEGNPDLHMCHVVCRVLPWFGSGARAALCYKHCITPGALAQMPSPSCSDCGSTGSGCRYRNRRCRRR